jgi:mycothiol synthase
MDTRQIIENVISATETKKIQGLIFRGFAGETDYANILAIIDGSKQLDNIKRSDTLEDVKRNYAHLHNCDPYQDMLFAEVDGQAIGYTRVWWEITADGEWHGFSLAFLLPEWRHKGIGTQFLYFTEERLREISENLLKSGQLTSGAPRFYSVFVTETETGKEALLQHAGYAPIRYFFSMVRPDLENIPDLPLPSGLEVRPVQPEHRRQIWDASQEAFRDHWGYIPEPDEEYEKLLADPNVDPSLWQVAWDGEEVAGMVQNFILKEENQEYNRKRGYTEGICTRRPWRKRGLARALIARSLSMLKELGMEEAALGVDAENISGALRLYESMGYRMDRRHANYRKSLG